MSTALAGEGVIGVEVVYGYKVLIGDRSYGVVKNVIPRKRTRDYRGEDPVY